MVGAQKTLKVTYGSFSCTLEGFEDPVAALVAVTRHFQSLAAPETLFAAEGRVPDAEVLLRLPDTDVPPQDPRDDGPGRPAVRPGSPVGGGPSAPDPDADVSRLLSQTMVEMQGADQRRRLATFGHLKAAVAATQGDPGAGRDDPTRQDRYRADLARVVRPVSAPRPDQVRKPAPQDPLLLVPELRVDQPDPPQDAARTEPAPTLPAALADLADRIGTKNFPDLMEVAAAVLTCTRNSESFTRPDLMHEVSALSAARGGTPEDQMRGFGILLRDGRILRAGRGNFCLPPDAPVLALVRRLTA